MMMHLNVHVDVDQLINPGTCIKVSENRICVSKTRTFKQAYFKYRHEDKTFVSLRRETTYQ